MSKNSKNCRKLQSGTEFTLNLKTTENGRSNLGMTFSLIQLSSLNIYCKPEILKDMQFYHRSYN